MPIDYIQIPTELFKLGIRGEYRLSILALVYNFRERGLQISNGKLAKVFFVDKRTIERAIKSLKKDGYIKDNGTGKNDRTLVLSTDILSALDTDILSGGVPTLEGVSTDKTADHNKRKKYINTNTDFAFVLRDKNLWQLPQVKLDEYRAAYPNLDIEAELKKALQWLVDNPVKRKTASGMARFLNGWLSRTKPQQQDNKPKPFTPEAEQAFLAANSREITEAQADELFAEVGIV